MSTILISPELKESIIRRIVEEGKSCADYTAQNVPYKPTRHALGHYDTVMNSVEEGSSSTADDEERLVFVPGTRRSRNRDNLKNMLSKHFKHALEQHPLRSPTEELVANLCSRDVDLVRNVKLSLLPTLLFAPHLHIGANILLLLLFFTEAEVARAYRRFDVEAPEYKVTEKATEAFRIIFGEAARSDMADALLSIAQEYERLLEF